MGKNILKGDKIGVLLLVLITIFAGYMGCSKRFMQPNDQKVKTENKSYDRNNYTYNDSNIYDDMFDDEYYDDNEEYEYNYSGYKYGEEYVYDYSYDNSMYNDRNAPTVYFSSRDIINQYESFDPWKGIRAHHTKFGDVTGLIEITYNDLDINIPGTYSIVYKACNYPGSIYCRTVTKEVVVRSGDEPSTSKYYGKGPVWSNTSSKSCSEGSTSCESNRITKPTAKDPYSNRELNVELINGYVDIYTPGTYVLVYYATTEQNISGTTTKTITITEDYNYSNNNYNDYNSNNKYNKTSKYISNYESSYYDDGQYRGYLNANNNNRQTSKYISNYEWTNNVSYTYRCDNKNKYGTSGWSLISTNTSDDHPTYYYNVGGFSGTLNKSSFYCVKGSGCEEDLNRNLGTCTNVGQTKNVYRKWVGVYSGYVYTNQVQTYSGYVYSYR